MRTSWKIGAFLVPLAFAAVACGKTVSPGAGGSTSQGRVSLQVETAGGFLPREYALAALPEFTLSPEGLVVTQGAQISIFPPPALPSLMQRTITKRGIERIIAAAEAAGLNGPDKHYENNMVADAGTTTFTYVDGAGVKHKISAYALEIGDGMGGAAQDQSAEDREARAKLAKLREQLVDLPSWMEPDDLGQESSYEYAALRVFTMPYGAGNPELPQKEKPWPLTTVLSKFGSAFEAPATRCGVADGSDAATLRAAAKDANSLTPWTSENKPYLLIFRPLLPGESGCPSSSQS